MLWVFVQFEVHRAFEDGERFELGPLLAVSCSIQELQTSLLNELKGVRDNINQFEKKKIVSFVCFVCLLLLISFQDIYFV